MQSPAAESEPGAGDAPPSETDDEPLSFAADVGPIFSAHCLKCHDAKKRSGGLRLDARQHAKRGGDSGRPVLGGPPATNELFARVSAHDRSYRMPKNAPPLADAEIEILKRWVEQGTPWPDPIRSASTSRSFYDRWLDYVGNWADRHRAEFTYVLPYSIGALAFYCLLLVVMRCRAAYRGGRAWTTGRMARFCRFCDGIKAREMLLVLVLSLAGLALAAGRGHMLEIERRLQAANEVVRRTKSPWSRSIYGLPPKPIRPDHPKQVAGTYYRGNCERNKELFNGGNYLTATFHVNLCDKDHRQLDVGQAVPESGVFVRVEIERAPGTTELLFSKELMASVLFVKGFAEEGHALNEAPTRLETLEPDKRWVAYMPIGTAERGEVLSGVIYIYTGAFEDQRVNGSLQYAVGYELQFADGKLAPESDVWMNSFGNGAFADPEPAGKLPYREWFDYRPMPVITGENSKDPKLLGVPEYVEKGLIAPGAEKPVDPPDEADPPTPTEKDEGKQP